MAIRHRAFLLDAGAFRMRISQILASLEAGDAHLLFEQALTVVEQTTPEQWPLEVAGSSLLDIRKVNFGNLPGSIESYLNDVSSIHSYDIGYWLLLIFSTYLRKCRGIGSNYSILDGILDMLDWNQEDRRLLFEGTTTATLLKPDAVPVLTDSQIDSYWHWMRPLNAYAAGWLSQEQISELYYRLLSKGESIRMFDYRRFGNRWMMRTLSVPDGQLDYLKRLHTAYEKAMEMLETARQAKMELYMTLSYI